MDHAISRVVQASLGQRDGSTLRHRRTSTLNTIELELMRPEPGPSALGEPSSLGAQGPLRPPSPPTPWRTRASAPSSPGFRPPSFLLLAARTEARTAIQAQRTLHAAVQSYRHGLGVRRWIEFNLLRGTLAPAPQPHSFVDSYGQTFGRPEPLPQATMRLMGVVHRQLELLEANGSREEMSASVTHALLAFEAFYKLVWELLAANHPYKAQLFVQSSGSVGVCLFANPMVGPRQALLPLQPFEHILLRLRDSPLGSERLLQLLSTHWETFVASANSCVAQLQRTPNLSVSPPGTVAALLEQTARYGQVARKLRGDLQGDSAASIFSDFSDV